MLLNKPVRLEATRRQEAGSQVGLSLQSLRAPASFFTSSHTVRIQATKEGEALRCLSVSWTRLSRFGPGLHPVSSSCLLGDVETCCLAAALTSTSNVTFSMIKCNYLDRCSADSQQVSRLIPQQSLHLIRAFSVIHKTLIAHRWRQPLVPSLLPSANRSAASRWRRETCSWVRAPFSLLLVLLTGGQI